MVSRVLVKSGVCSTGIARLYILADGVLFAHRLFIPLLYLLVYLLMDVFFVLSQLARSSSVC